MPIAPGTRLDRYQIISLLGVGGMGEVHLALDTRLGRKVALKLLPAEFARDTERLRRFEQEAQAASALNHPNIITIYEIGRVQSEAGESPFIAAEYVEGSTLRKRLALRRLTLDEAIDVATQAASALVAAHSAGIIHRDIKPENLMLRPDGYVKVLDFGLAKLTEQGLGLSAEGESLTEALDRETTTDARETRPDSGRYDMFATTRLETRANTAPGLVLGTAHYMSPEQARGIEVDARTDIFSLGVVLYEMVTTHAPFDGPTTSDVIASLLTTEPLPLAHYFPEVPDLLEWITAKALTKDRDERYQTAREMLNDLKRFHQRLEVATELARAQNSGGAARQSFFSRHSPAPGSATENLSPDTGALPAVRQTSRLRRLLGGIRGSRSALVASLLLLAAIVGAVAFGIRQLNQPAQPWPAAGIQAMKVTRFTTTGTARRAAVSPDGKYVVYVSDGGGKQSLLVRQVASASQVEIVPAAEVFYRGMTFSLDGNFIYYLVQEGNNPIQVLYQVPVLGGVPRRVLINIDSPVTFSPDGRQFAFVRRYRAQGEDALVLANADGTGERKLFSRHGADFFSVSGPSWSPDGQMIACAAGSNTGTRHVTVVAVSVAEGAEKQITRQSWSNIGRVAWLRGGRSLIVSATESGSTLAQVWLITYPDGEARRVTNDLNDYNDVSLSEDSTAMVTVQFEARVNIWTALGVDPGAARQITSGVGQYNGVRGATWLPDGRIAYVSRASGSQDVWLMNADGLEQRQLTTPETRADVYPAASPDGRYLVIVSTRAGNSNLWRIDPDGSNWQQLTSGGGEEFPAFTPDGKWVVYTATGSSKFTLWKVPVGGGEPVQLTDRLSQWPAVSPDGKQIACWYRGETNSPWRIALLPAEGGPPAQEFEVPTTAATSIPVRWSGGGRALDFVDTRDGVSNIWRQPLAGGQPRPVTDFRSDQIFWFDWSPDAKKLLCSRGSVTSDVILFSQPR